MQVDVPPEVLLQQIHALSKKVGLYRTIKVCFVEEPPEFDTANGKRF
ncbi:hypothetical protein [Neisseria mucosa]|nr:hypothetical protein [Neisseria mucosa]